MSSEETFDILPDLRHKFNDMAAIHATDPAHSTHVLQPTTSSTTNKPLAPAPGFIPIINQLGPTKEWTIPPRPKPGRKPALDAPPTKRKAQNREAQRTFRERRAAKVGELEDQMKQMEEEDQREQDELRVRIKELLGEVDMWQSLSESWRKRSEKLEAEMDHERHAKERLELELQMLKQSTASSTDAVPLRSRRHRRAVAALEKGAEEGQDYNVEENVTCGKCSNDSRCQCIEDAFKMNDIASGTAENDGLKRPLSPQRTLNCSKRLRRNDSDNEPTEIDFTTRYPSDQPTNTNSSASATAPAATTAGDSCGFCQDGTPCICAEINRQNESERKDQLTFYPDSDAKIDQLSGTCTQNPGTCTQCQSIPASKTFCISLAESRLSNTNSNSRTPIPSSEKAPTMNCADAFTRLAQHPAFPRASAQLNTWVPTLASGSVPSTSSTSCGNSLEGRTAFEIEAASVMNVLKSFDVRFGDDLPRDE